MCLILSMVDYGVVNGLMIWTLFERKNPSALTGTFPSQGRLLTMQADFIIYASRCFFKCDALPKLAYCSSFISAVRFGN